MNMITKSSKIYIAGHLGMVGSSIKRKLISKNYDNLITKSSKELDLRNQNNVNKFFAKEKPDIVFLSAAKVGGIYANNKYRAEFIYDNLMIQSNIIHSSYLNNVKKLIFLGSSCIYPKLAKQPINENELLKGNLESSNKPYAISKISGITMCESYRYQYGCNFISLMPTNLYGTNDNYHKKNSHVIPALIRKFVEAKFFNKSKVEVWGSGKPLREFLHVDDLADACYFLMLNYDSSEIINVGSGEELSIKNLSKLISKITKYDGKILYGNSKLDGTPRKLLDCSKIKKLGWSSKINLKEGLKKTINEFKKKFNYE